MQKVHGNPEKPLEIPWEAEAFGQSAGIIVEAKIREAENRGIRACFYALQQNPKLTAEEIIARYNNDKPNYRVE